MRGIDTADRPWLRLILTGALALALAACGTRQPPGSGDYPVGGGDYRRDGPHANPPANLASVPDAVPRLEPFASGPNRPYVINGKRYTPDTTGGPYRIRGRASWYGRQFHGRPTSSGERYDMYAMTAAHPTLPIPSYVRVTRADSGRSVIVRINDRGPFHSERVIDLSYVAAYKLDTLKHGTAEVIVERIMPEEIRRGPTAYASAAASAPPVPAQPPAAPIATAALTTAAVPTAAAPVSVLQTASSTAGASLPASRPPATETGDAISLWMNSSRDTRLIPVPQAPMPAQTAQTPPVSTVTAPPSMPATGTAAFLQLGAFGEAHNAQQLADRIRDHVTGLGQLEVVSQDGEIYRVRLGPFTDRNTAVAHVDTVYQQTGIRPHVVAR